MSQSAHPTSRVIAEQISCSLIFINSYIGSVRIFFSFCGNSQVDIADKSGIM